MLFSPTIGAAISAGYWILRARCPTCPYPRAVLPLLPTRTLRSLNCCPYRRAVLPRSITQSVAATDGSASDGRRMIACLGETFYWMATIIAGLLFAWVLWGYSFNGIIPIVVLLLAAVIWLTGWACRKVLE